MTARALPLLAALDAAAESRWKLPLLGGILLGVAYYTPTPVLNLVAFAPLLHRIDAFTSATSSRVAKPAWVTGLLFGLAAHLLTLYFCYALLRFTWLAGLLYLCFALALAVRIALSTVLLAWLRRHTGWSYGLLLPLSWLPFEWLQTKGDLRMTGDHLAHTVAGHPFLIQFADVVGHYGVTLVVLTLGGLIYEAALGTRPLQRRRAAVSLAVLVATVLTYDSWAWWRNGVATQQAETLKVALVQPNIALDDKMDPDRTSLQQWATLEQATLQLAPSAPELIVWPESARPRPVVYWVDRPDPPTMTNVQALARRVGAAMLVGVEYAEVRAPEDYDLYNAVLAVDADGNLLPDWGAKQYLVPFAEALPFRGLLGPLVEGRGGEWRWIAGSFAAASKPAVLEILGRRIGVLVCYEQLFPDLGRHLRDSGAELGVVVTNDAWWGHTQFQHYQADALRLRAIENRMAFVRVANTGISGFVDRRGRYAKRTALFQPAAETDDVELNSARTIYNRIGDAVVWIVLAGLGAAVARALRR